MTSEEWERERDELRRWLKSLGAMRDNEVSVILNARRLGIGPTEIARLTRRGRATVNRIIADAAKGDRHAARTGQG